MDYDHLLSAQDKKAVTEVISAFEHAVQELDFAKPDSFVMPDARWIEDSYSWLVRQWPQWLKDARTGNLRITFTYTIWTFASAMRSHLHVSEHDHNLNSPSDREQNKS